MGLPSLSSEIQLWPVQQYLNELPPYTRYIGVYVSTGMPLGYVMALEIKLHKLIALTLCVYVCMRVRLSVYQNTTMSSVCFICQLC